MSGRKPKYTLDNYRESYEFSKKHRPWKWPVKLAYAALNAYYKPTVELEYGAREDLDRINAEGLPHIYACNHLTTDHMIVGPILRQIAPDDIGRVRLMGNNVTLQEYRLLADMVGAIPVFRKIDHPDEISTAKESYSEMYECTDHVLQNGYKISLHPEGETNRDNPLIMSKIKKGVSIIALRAAPSAITPIGYTYGPDNLDSPKRGNIHAFVGRSLFVTSEQSVEDITDRVAIALQNAVTSASLHY